MKSLAFRGGQSVHKARMTYTGLAAAPGSSSCKEGDLGAAVKSQAMRTGLGC